MSWLRLYVLGTPRIEIDGTAVEIPRRKAIALLVYLAITKRLHSREALATFFWPNADQSHAYTYLRVALLTLNQSLGREWFDIHRDRIGIDCEAPIWMDRDQFRELVDTPDSEAAEHALRQAVEMYQGGFLQGFTIPDSFDFDEWQYFQRELVHRELEGALKRLIDHYASQGGYELAIQYAQQWLALDGINESAHQELMRLYYWSGQRALALRQYEECAACLAAELNVTPEKETAALYRAIQTQDEAALRLGSIDRRTDPTPITLYPAGAERPPRGHVVGDTLVISSIVQFLQTPGSHLVNLTGPEGIGKTALALRVGAVMGTNYRNGVCLVPLGPHITASLVFPTIAAAAGLLLSRETDPKSQILSWMIDKHILLILDDFQYQARQARQLVNLLRSLPQVDLLLTSRGELGLPDEVVFPIRGLPCPDSETTHDLLDYPAVKLFVQRAQYIRARFEPDARELQDIARICRLVAGNPLAIRLAAAWSKKRPPHAIADELGRRVGRSGSGYMRGVFDGLWNLLEAGERTTLMKLSVFRGSFTPQAAEAIAEATPHTLSSLLDQSLIQHDLTQGRYRMNNILRQYAEECLEISGLAHDTRAAHSAYFVDFLHKHLPPFNSWQQTLDHADIEREFENIKAAWIWATQHREYEIIDQTLGSIYLFCATATPEKSLLWPPSSSYYAL